MQGTQPRVVYEYPENTVKGDTLPSPALPRPPCCCLYSGPVSLLCSVVAVAGGGQVLPWCWPRDLPSLQVRRDIQCERSWVCASLRPIIFTGCLLSRQLVYGPALDGLMRPSLASSCTGVCSVSHPLPITTVPSGTGRSCKRDFQTQWSSTTVSTAALVLTLRSIPALGLSSREDDTAGLSALQIPIGDACPIATTLPSACPGTTTSLRCFVQRCSAPLTGPTSSPKQEQSVSPLLCESWCGWGLLQ